MTALLTVPRRLLAAANDLRRRIVRLPSGGASHYESHRVGLDCIALCGRTVGRTVVSTSLGRPSCADCCERADKEEKR